MKKLLASILVIGMSIAGAIRTQAAVTCFAVDEGNMLYRFSSNTPGTTTAKAITNLPMGYRIVGLDFRTTKRTSGAANPGVGSLWALGTDGSLAKVFTINPNTAAATLVGNLPAITVSGGDNGWFFGFDPAKDILRIMNFIDNYAVNPNNLAVTEDTKFNDPSATNPDHFPALNGSAYTTAAFGGTSSIYFLDQGNDGLNTSANISTGDFSALPMPDTMVFGFSQPAGLDISGAETLGCAFNTVTNKQTLFRISRTTGQVTILGEISSSPGTLSLRALAIQPLSPVTVKITKPKSNKTKGKTILLTGTATCADGIKAVQFRVGSGPLKSVKGNLTKWKLTAALKVGGNVISVRAIGKNNVVSAYQKIKIIRLKP